MEPPSVDSEIFNEAFKYNPQVSTATGAGGTKAEMKEGKGEVAASSSSAEETERSCDFDSQDEDQIENFLLMGLSKGSVIFVRV